MEEDLRNLLNQGNKEPEKQKLLPPKAIIKPKEN